MASENHREDSVRYVEVLDPSASGWSAMFKTVREADISKVEDCRDDIDTLLVFAGLYSAVLTAFVIESYKNLQQDSQDVIVGLLKQLVAQNYTSGPGFLNSTTPSPQIPDFAPPLWAIRVNVLWFTSLLLSLSSASFGILVKQWLREYMALEYADPRQRLRARQYRNPALAEWKVFEIAAVLPILLQVSLGLFFLGLCFFTSAVHSSIGHATVPVVSAWVFLLLITTIAPLFSPRCPFKTTFLKASLKAGRRYVVPAIHNLIAVLRWARDSADHLWYGFSSWSAADGFNFTPLWVRIPVAVAGLLVFMPYWVPIVLRRALGYLAFHAKRGLSRKPLPGEEGDIIKTEEEDIPILLSVDSLMSDDGLLPTMLDALRQQAASSPATVVEFVFEVVGRRCGETIVSPLRQRLDTTLDLRFLSKFAWNTTTEALANALLQHGRGLVEASSPEWIFNVVVFLLSRTLYMLSEASTRALASVFVPRKAPDHPCVFGATLDQRITEVGAYSSDTTPPLFSLPKPPVPICLRCIIDEHKPLLCTDPQCTHPSLRHLLDTHRPDDFANSSERTMQNLFDVIIPFLSWIVSLQVDWREIQGAHEAFHIVLEYGDRFNRHNAGHALRRALLHSEAGTYIVLTHLAVLYPNGRPTLSSTERIIFGDSLLGRSRIALAVHPQPALTHSRAVLTVLCGEGFDGSDVTLDFVRLCRLYIDLDYGKPQRGMWQLLAKGVKRYYETEGWRKELRREYWHSDAPAPGPEVLYREDQEMACECLKHCDARIDVPDVLFEALWAFVPQERAQEFRRVLPRSLRVRLAGSRKREDAVDAAGRATVNEQGPRDVPGEELEKETIEHKEQGVPGSTEE